jgi:uncharacterized membrane protein
MSDPTSSWRLPIALVALATIPVIAGSLRLIDLATGSTVMPVNPRFAATPLPVVIHILSAMVFALLGAFQFSTRLRRRHRAWHRRAGRIVMVAGLGVGLSALWLNQFFPRAGATRELLYPVRAVFGVAMLVVIALGFLAARRRDFANHRAWMIRSYAIGLVAGTQAFTLGVGGAILGHGQVTTALLLVSAWAINLTVAEWAIRQRRPRRTTPASAQMAMP